MRLAASRSLGKLGAVIAEPRAALGDDVELYAEVDKLARARYAFAEHYVELGATEGWRNLVLYHFYHGVTAQHVVAVLEGRARTYVEANRRVEFEGVTAGSGLSRAEHLTDFLA